MSYQYASFGRFRPQPYPLWLVALYETRTFRWLVLGWDVEERRDKDGELDGESVWPVLTPVTPIDGPWGEDGTGLCHGMDHVWKDLPHAYTTDPIDIPAVVRAFMNDKEN